MYVFSQSVVYMHLYVYKIFYVSCVYHKWQASKIESKIDFNSLSL